MKRGEIWLVRFDPSEGGEARKTRPAVVVSADEMNARLNRVQVVPLTSNVTKVFSTEARINSAQQPSKASANQLTTAAKHRGLSKLGQVTEVEMAAIERAVRRQLAL